MRIGARLDGLTDAVNALGNLPGAFADEAANTIAIGAGIIEAEAKARAPVDEGDLARSIGTNIRDDGLQAAIGAGDFKARFIEFGTEDTRAQPFLYPAFRIGARFVRRDMRKWAAGAGRRVKSKTRRGKRENRGATAGR